MSLIIPPFHNNKISDQRLELEQRVCHRLNALDISLSREAHATLDWLSCHVANRQFHFGRGSDRERGFRQLRALGLTTDSYTRLNTIGLIIAHASDHNKRKIIKDPMTHKREWTPLTHSEGRMLFTEQQMDMLDYHFSQSSEITNLLLLLKT